jgi:hypothetical protein
MRSPYRGSLVIPDNCNFTAAAFYAREQSKRPEAAALYKEAVTPRLSSVYAVAMPDYLSGPKIIDLSTVKYKGAVGDPIKQPRRSRGPLF